MAEYTTKTIQGSVTAVEDKETQAGKRYASVTIDGEFYTAWGAEDIQNLRLAMDSGVPVIAEGQQKEGSKYWNLRKVSINTDGAAAPTSDASRNGSALPARTYAPRDPNLSLKIQREKALQFAVEASADGAEPAVIVATARTFEAYLAGTDTE